jgi:hypothetical protein
LTYHPDCQRKLVTGTLPPRAAADGPDCRRAMTEMESRDRQHPGKTRFVYGAGFN